MGEMLNAQAEGVNYGLQAMETRAQGAAARAQGYAEGWRLEEGARAELEVAAENLMTLRRNEVMGMAAERAARGSSGFMVSEGSQLAGELSVAEVFEKQVADLRRGASVGAGNAYRQAARLRREGDNAMAAAEVSARALDAFARRSRRMAPWLGVGSALGTVGSVLGAYNFSMNGKDSQQPAAANKKGVGE